MIASSLTEKFNMNKKKMFLVICTVALIYAIAYVLYNYYELTENFWQCTLTVYLPYRIMTDHNQTFTQLKKPTNFNCPHFKEVDESLFDKLFLENEDSRDIWDTLGKFRNVWLFKSSIIFALRCSSMNNKNKFSWGQKSVFFTKLFLPSFLSK